MTKTKNFLFFLTIGVLFVLIGLFILSNKKETIQIIPSPTPSIAPSAVEGQSFAKVTHVIDGDTIEIEGGQRVRYIGIDAAEVYPKPLCFSGEALAENRKLVLGKVVRLEKDQSETDKYGRLLRYVFIDNVFVNNELVKKGFAKVMAVPPDVKYENKFSESEKSAKENNLGLWGKCGRR
jgi:micrococcal nuclease